MRHRSIVHALLAVMLLTGALVACGGDDAPSKEDFAQNADKVCADVEDRIQQLDNADPESVKELERLIADIKSTGDAGIKRLEGLERPDGDAGTQAEEFVSATKTEWNERAVPALDELTEAVRNKDEVALRSAGRKLDSLQNTPSEKIAEDLGADECAEG